MKYLLSLALFFASTPPLCYAQAARPYEVVQASDSLQHLLPLDSASVWVMELVTSPRLDSLLQRFQAALKSDPAWLQRYVAQANLPPGEPLPYHPKLGLSQPEYEEMQELLLAMTYAPASEAVLRVREVSEGRFVFDGGEALPGLSGIIIDTNTGEIETPFGLLTGGVEVLPHIDQKLTGPWAGFAWSVEAIDAETVSGAVISFDLGKLVESGYGLLHYDARQVEGGELRARVKRVLTYDLR